MSRSIIHEHGRSITDCIAKFSCTGFGLKIIKIFVWDKAMVVLHGQKSVWYASHTYHTVPAPLIKLLDGDVDMFHVGLLNSEVRFDGIGVICLGWTRAASRRHSCARNCQRIEIKLDDFSPHFRQELSKYDRHLDA